MNYFIYTYINVLTYAVVLSLTPNREVDLKRRDLIRPDLNKKYASLCNPSTPASSLLFTDELNKEMEELTKSHKLSILVTPRSAWNPTRFLQVEARVVVAALARVMVVAKPLQVLF